MRLIFHNNRSMTANSIEKHCSDAMNVKLQELNLKRFIDFQNCFILLSSWALLATQLVWLEIFVYPRNKHIIYGAELNV